MLAKTKYLLQRAQKGHYAVGHFNTNNLETMQAIISAAVKLNSPIILATSAGAIDYAGMEYLVCLANTASKLNKIPIALHLDHGRDLKLIKKAIDLGYSSVMFDGSHLSFEENIKLTKKVVSWAHQKGVSVEAELGTIGGAEENIISRNIIYTNPLSAQEFVKKTGCDFLAVAIGTSHGAYKFSEKSNLNIELLTEIKNRVKIPLVLHGASTVPLAMVKQAEHYGAKLGHVCGVSNAQLKLAVKHGICKVNTDTDLRIAFDAGVRKFIKEKPQDFDPRHILAPARATIQQVVEDKIKLLSSIGKAYSQV
ncbi:class II fructose-1,6-bisphosphate aldolase [Candidatus Woesearchaeota archaeon]|nr:class II fructose-1,6-bisphosphate aldolase [Candidatus Woesearchaeota archaeon]